MKYVILGGDHRFEYLAKMLKKRGNTHWIHTKTARPEDFAALSSAENIIMNYPLKGDFGGFTFDKILDTVPSNAWIYLCGPGKIASKTTEIRESSAIIPENSADNRDILPQIIDLWADEQLILENAALTAEGAIAAAMQANSRSLRDSHCLVVGWGRIGRALTEILVGMGARVTVASRSQSGRNRAIERGALAVNTDHLRLKGFDVVFSTPPAMVINEEVLKKADMDNPTPPTLAIDKEILKNADIPTLPGMTVNEEVLKNAESPISLQQTTVVDEEKLKKADVPAATPPSMIIDEKIPKKADVSASTPPSMTIAEEIPKKADVPAATPPSMTIDEEIPKKADVSAGTPPSMIIDEKIPKKADAPAATLPSMIIDEKILKKADVPVATLPSMIIDEKILKKADMNILILDLASPPYGVDLKAAWDLGLRAWREPALPGRYCPESAAMAILRAIDRSKGGSR